MSDQIIHFNEIINKTFENIQLEKVENAKKIIGVWEKVLLGIKSYNPNEGKNIFSHSRIVDLKNGVLLVEADHPGWIELLQLHKKFILTGIKKYEPNLNISTLAFRLKGKRGELFDFEKNSFSQKELEKQIEKRVREEENKLKNVNLLQEKYQEVNKKDELPPELNAIFEDLKKSRLTKF